MMVYRCSFPGCDTATTRAHCRQHRVYEDARVVCLFCKGEFDSLPFYGCCSKCYTGSSIVRVLVDASTPQTAHGQEPFVVDGAQGVSVEGVVRW
jgi:hypothetical protein